MNLTKPAHPTPKFPSCVEKFSNDFLTNGISIPCSKELVWAFHMLPNKWSKASSCPLTVQFYSAYECPAKKSLQSIKAYSTYLHASV